MTASVNDATETIGLLNLDFTVIDIDSDIMSLGSENLLEVMPGASAVKRKGNDSGTHSSNHNSVKHSNGDAHQRNNISQKNSQEKGKNTKNSALLKERASLVLWRKPFKTLQYFFKEVFVLLYRLSVNISQHRIALFSTLLVVIAIVVLSNVSGPHQDVLGKIKIQAWWCVYWLGLGVLSSIGLGTGLHTFVLYLGPHIAAVTLAAYECGSLNFPEPPYPDKIVCAASVDPSWSVTVWNILRKVRVEAMMWGAGTALGELPPYFMARAARLSGSNSDDEFQELEALEKAQKKNKPLSRIDRLKLYTEKLVKKAGFFGILACASIPNPLFDLAGITCGHFLIPFWTFFGATLIGKAIIKMSIQTVFVIIAFNETLIDRFISFIAKVPVISEYLTLILTQFLSEQKEKFHGGSKSKVESKSILAVGLEMVVVTMVIFFLVSIINSLAQDHHKRIHKSPSGKRKSKD
nr:PREDICTED: vacuole membrane protein 1-like isoform X1 [Bemisia tabaci]